MTPHGLVAYAWDPLVDDLDDEDTLDEKPIVNPPAVRAPLSACDVPIYQHFTDNGRTELIIGNTRINSTGQATFVEFNP
ncbi:hypothetical protein H2248_012063 [Termitomyces sp. 'cryptogamus']|nr:hypothetical protein H2248_012063 [Termitomyces sp. 'cryptogamus']